jgi:hypothetical protein
MYLQSFVLAFLTLTVTTGLHAQGKSQQWWRGNTHVHTVLSNHADSTPEEVSQWYLDRGYNFLVLSEHNKFIDPAKVKLPSNRRKDFILIPGVEVTGPKKIHSTALNVKKVIPWQFDHADKWRIVEEQQRLIETAGGTMILNHPTWTWALDFDDLKQVPRLGHFELYNGSPDTHNHGDLHNDSTEALWDKLLSNGQKVYAVASDDAHQFKSKRPEDSNPGTGWIMVRGGELNANAISTAIKLGQFYASSGIVLKDFEYANGQFCVWVDEAATKAMLAKDYVVGHRHNHATQHVASHYQDGMTIEFITREGEVLASTQATQACSSNIKASLYLRAKITFTREVKLAGKESTKEEFYAWTQPIFLP